MMTSLTRRAQRVAFGGATTDVYQVEGGGACRREVGRGGAKCQEW